MMSSSHTQLTSNIYLHQTPLYQTLKTHLRTLQAPSTLPDIFDTLQTPLDTLEPPLNHLLAFTERIK